MPLSTTQEQAFIFRDMLQQRYLIIHHRKGLALLFGKRAAAVISHIGLPVFSQRVGPTGKINGISLNRPKADTIGIPTAQSGTLNN